MKKFNAPFKEDHQLNKYIDKHLRNPTTDSFLNYSRRIIQIVEKHNYNFHKVIYPNAPIYAFSLDLDFRDKNMSEKFHLCKSKKLWNVQSEMMEFFRELIWLYFKLYHKLDDMSSTSYFAIYRSIPDDATKTALIEKGIRGRLVWRSTKYMLDNAKSAYNLSENINRFFVEVLLTSENTVFDSNVHKNASCGSHSMMRLPLCMKENISATRRTLVPILMDNTMVYIPHFGMIHEKASSFDTKEGIVLTIPTSQQGRFEIEMNTLYQRLMIQKNILVKHSKMIWIKPFFVL